MKFTTELVQGEGKNVVGIIIPPAIIEGFLKGKRPPVRVTINGYSYRSTVAVMGGNFMVASPPNIAKRPELKADRLSRLLWTSMRARARWTFRRTSTRLCGWPVSLRVLTSWPSATAKSMSGPSMMQNPPRHANAGSAN